MNVYAYLVEHNRYMNVLGIGVILAIAWCFSLRRHAINYGLVVKALALQVCLAYIALKTFVGRDILAFIARGVASMYQFADAGISFVFGELANPAGPAGFVFAIKVLPIIIFFGAFMAILFHCGIVQRAVSAINVLLQPLFGTSGAESLCAIANSFLGQTEAPLLVRHYLPTMTKSELLVVMVSGMATISGAILAVYAAMGVPASHMLASCVMSIPGSILLAKMLLPETETPQTGKGSALIFEKPTGTLLGAIAAGTSDGLQLALNVGAMLISFLSLLALGNAVLGAIIGWYNAGVAGAMVVPPLTIETIFGYVGAPFAYLLGFTGMEAMQIGQILGTKVAVNELIAYSAMVKMQLAERTKDIATYALCGFSNFSCIGIQIGGIGALMPEKRHWLAELGLYALLGGTLTNILSAMIASLLL